MQIFKNNFHSNAIHIGFVSLVVIAFVFTFVIARGEVKSQGILNIAPREKTSGETVAGIAKIPDYDSGI